MNKNSPTALVILDGFGCRDQTDCNAIVHAHREHLDARFAQYPSAILRASGAAVGLPDNYISNSSVGHLIIGSGRIIKQPILVIHDAIADKSFFTNPLLVQQLDQLKKTGNVLHIMGLLSDGGVHTDIEHLYAFLDAAHQHGIKHVYIHAFLDGRDTAPQSASTYLDQLDNALSQLEYGSIGSIHGRFYAMDRDKNWDRTQKSYNILTSDQDTIPKPWEEILVSYYKKGIFDEFILPTQLDPTSAIQDGDGIIFFNFRTDRARQLTEAFVNPAFTAFKTKPLKLSCFITPTDYGAHLKTTVLFPTQHVTETLKDVLSENGKTIFSIAETEKYAHITYFFDGGREKQFPHETRVLIPSIPARNYVENPQMSAKDVTRAVLESLRKHSKDFYLINYANADVVGHSGNFNATVKAIECLDHELNKLYKIIVEEMDGTLYITADHGKAEEMFDPIAHQPRTAHTNNPVPFLMLKKGLKKACLPLTQLADIAPFILKNMKIPVPKIMQKK